MDVAHLEFEDVSQGPLNDSPLHAAAAAGSLEKLLTLTSDASAAHEVEKLEGGSTLPRLLWLASNHGHDDCVRLLLDKSSDPNVATRNRSTPLFAACRLGHMGCAQLLLSRGANPNTLDDMGRSPLMAACAGRHPMWCDE